MVGYRLLDVAGLPVAGCRLPMPIAVSLLKASFRMANIHIFQRCKIDFFR
jgi:hypothetical protein